ncbi:MAG: hypothetical protein LBU87_06980 [Lactobacillales bacterium]|jgi:hypothetical protein|nr:hypothetical protein [Lactobacillales bacterium]
MKSNTKNHTSESNFHAARRAFVLIDGIGLLLLENASPLSHTDALLNMGLSPTQADNILSSSPRGYMKDNTLVLYQGDFFSLTSTGIATVKKYFPDLTRLFALTPATTIHNGVHKGRPGETWRPVETLPFNTFWIP